MGFLSGVDAIGAVTNAIRQASRSTGSGFDYLVKTAMRESSMNPSAKAPTSSAAGLFQFIESTWLQTVKEDGPRHGLQDYADLISRRSDGSYHVSDGGARERVLALRYEPQAAAMMAGAFTQRNAEHLTQRLGRAPTDGELYLAHFLGAEGGAKLIALAAQHPEAAADGAFPREAAANRSIFYSKNGEARTAIDVYRTLVRKHERDVSVAAVEMPEQDGPPREPGLFDRRFSESMPFFYRLYDAPDATSETQSAAIADVGFWHSFAPEDGTGPLTENLYAFQGQVAEADVPLPEPRPGSDAVSDWAARSRKGAGQPLDLARAASLYARVGNARSS